MFSGRSKAKQSDEGELLSFPPAEHFEKLLYPLYGSWDHDEKLSDFKQILDNYETLVLKQSWQPQSRVENEAQMFMSPIDSAL